MAKREGRAGQQKKKKKKKGAPGGCGVAGRICQREGLHMYLFDKGSSQRELTKERESPLGAAMGRRVEVIR